MSKQDRNLLYAQFAGAPQSVLSALRVLFDSNPYLWTVRVTVEEPQPGESASQERQPPSTTRAQDTTTTGARESSPDEEPWDTGMVRIHPKDGYYVYAPDGSRVIVTLSGEVVNHVLRSLRAVRGE